MLKVLDQIYVMSPLRPADWRWNLVQTLAVRLRGFFTAARAGDIAIDVLYDLPSGLRRTGHFAEQVTHAAALATDGLSLEGDLELAAIRGTADLAGEIPEATLRDRSELLRRSLRTHS